MQVKKYLIKFIKHPALLLLFVLVSFNVYAQETSSTTDVVEITTTTGAISTDTQATSTEVTEFIFSGTTTLATTTEIIAAEIIATSTLATSTDTQATTTLPIGTTTIDTGDAVALANVINTVNTNLINSTGTVILENLVNGSNADLDFRPTTNASDTSTTTISTTTTICTLLACNNVSTTTVEIIATSTIQNDIVLDASSGENTVETVENANIKTGDTLAGLNLVNVANTNIIDSNYLLISLNSFNDINGDIILPALTGFATNTESVNNHLAINNLNINQDSNLENNLDVKANSGENNISESENAVTNSGSSNSVTNVYNNINTFLVGGSSVSILLRVAGEWLGELIGLPAEAVFVQEGDTRILNYKTDNSNTNNNILNLPGVLSVNSTNTSSIVNNVTLDAESGKNNIANSEKANIKTGNSFAAANVINIVNVNVIARNWILAIINIFGNFHGNIVFAAPKVTPLTIATTSETIATTTASTTAILEITPVNNSSPNNGNNGNNINTNDVFVAENLNVNLNNLSTLTNNKKELKTQIPEKIVLGKIAEVSVIRNIIGNKQELKIKNLNHSPIMSVEFEDILYNPYGIELKREKWDIGEMLGDEEITLTYNIIFNGNAVTGTYSFDSVFTYSLNAKNEKLIFKQNGTLGFVQKTKAKKIKYISQNKIPVAAKINTNMGEVTGEVLGASIATQQTEPEISKEVTKTKQTGQMYLYTLLASLIMPLIYFFTRGNLG